MNLRQVAEELARRLTAIFLRDAEGPAARSTEEHGSSRRIRTGAITLSFHEYFHGDNGAGLGASHQTGWTGVIARIMHLFAAPESERVVGRKTTARKAPLSRGSAARR